MGWIGVDLDGTLAEYDGWKGIEHIGDPIPEMLFRVKKWVVDGVEVKIYTARAADQEREKAIAIIHKWLKKHGLPKLEVTCCKDYAMIECWDDRSVCVEENTGRILGWNKRR